MNVDELHQVLVEEIGIDGDGLIEAPAIALADLGLDSMAQVELGVVLRSRFGIEALPDETGDMSLIELAHHLGEIVTDAA